MNDLELEMINEIKNNILNKYGGVNEFVREYGGGVFNTTYVQWFMNNENYEGEEVEEFIEKWRRCFPS
jgi:hypothetical protein